MEENARNERMLQAIRCFLNGTRVDWQEGLSEEDWMELFILSRQHQVLPMVYEAVWSCPAFGSLPGEKAQMLKRQMIQQIMLQSRKTEEFLDLYKKLTENGLSPIVVKGIVCRSLYREPDYRFSGDEDVLIQREMFGRCHEIFSENGMKLSQPDRDMGAEGEISYYKDKGLLRVELHKELFAADSEAYGDFNDLFADAFDRKIETVINGVKIYTMCHTEHLLYLISHAFKHFLHSGFGIRQVCDIIVYANRYGGEIDWDELLTKCRSIHAEVFAAALFDIGERELVFDKEKAQYPEIWRQIDADGRDLLADLIAGGIFGDSSMSRKHSSNMTLQAVAADKRGAKQRASLRQSIFPGREYMERTYTYLKKYPFLLPAAWISRIGKYLIESQGTEHNDAMESIEIGNKRIDLMKKYKIIQ